MENPRVIDAGIRTDKICHKDTKITCGTSRMGQGSRLHLEDVLGHLPRRDVSLSRVYASNGIPMQAEAYRRGDLSVTITQGQRA